MSGFYCECGCGDGWHSSNLQGDSWSDANEQREELAKNTDFGVFIVNAECVKETDAVLVRGDGWAIVEDLS